MDLWTVIRGVGLGFSIAAPVGPIGVLCIRRTLAHGRLTGLASGLGAATADAVYGSIAAFGLSFISSLLISQQFILRLIGGGFLLYLGWKTFRSHPATEAAHAEASTLLGSYTSTLALTLTNPMTIISFAAIFAGAGLAAGEASAGGAALLVLGVFLGSALWWLTLSTGVSLLKSRLDNRALLWVNRISGLIVMTFGLLALWSLIG